jgi:hypothetical protein
MAEGSSNFGPAVDNVMERKPLVLNNRGYRWITDHVSSMVEAPVNFIWLVLTIIFGMIATLVPIQLAYQVSTGVGVWGLNNPVYWAWDITNFVFWIGIGHAGTLISAILFMTRQKWRTSINRSAEAMTIFAVICAGIFPAFHVGRVWFAWYLFPIPNPMSSGRISRVPCSGTCLRFRPISRFRSSSGIPGWFPIWPPFATGPRTRLRKWFYGILRPGLAGVEPELAALRKSLSHSGRGLDATGAFRAQCRFLRLCHLGDSRVGTPPFSRPTLWPGAVFWGLCHGLDPDDSGAAHFQTP